MAAERNALKGPKIEEMTISRDDHVSSRTHRGSKNLIVIGVLEDDRGDDRRNDDLHQGSVAVKQFAHIDATPGKLPAKLGAIQYVAQFGQKRKVCNELDAPPDGKIYQEPRPAAPEQARFISSTSRTPSLRAVCRDLCFDFRGRHRQERRRGDRRTHGLHSINARQRQSFPQQCLNDARLEQSFMSSLPRQSIGKCYLDGGHGRPPSFELSRIRSASWLQNCAFFSPGHSHWEWIPNDSGPAMPWLVYILRCRDGSLYTGITNDLAKRLKTHAAGKASRYTRSRLPVTLVYTVPHRSKSSALKREAAIKRLTRRAKIALLARAP